MDQLIAWDRELLIWLNSFHTPWLDSVMLFITGTFVWTPLYAFLIYLVFKYFKKDGWLVLAGAIITIVLCDRITSGLMKPYFARLRPSQDPSVNSIIHMVDNYKGGLYGFASGHAANSFGVALFIWLSLRRFLPWIGLVYIWASLMTYTRIYLGVHFPGDIIVGAVIGSCCGWIGYKISSLLISKYGKEKRLA